MKTIKLKIALKNKALFYTQFNIYAESQILSVKFMIFPKHFCVYDVGTQPVISPFWLESANS